MKDPFIINKKKKAKGERPPFVSKGTELEIKLALALEEARDHLEYCGYGDSWERSCAIDGGMDKRIDAAVDAAYEAGVLDKKEG